MVVYDVYAPACQNPPGYPSACRRAARRPGHLSGGGSPSSRRRRSSSRGNVVRKLHGESSDHPERKPAACLQVPCRKLRYGEA